MNIALWILQGLLGVAYTLGGGMKIFAYEKLGAKYGWVKDESRGLVAFIGACELLGGLGLILPGATHVFTVLTPAAAVGLTMIMLMAMGYRMGRKEAREFKVDIVFASLLAFIAIGRFVLAPLA